METLLVGQIKDADKLMHRETYRQLEKQQTNLQVDKLMDKETDG